MSSVTTTVLQPSPAAPIPIPSFTKTCHECGADLSHSHPPVPEDAQRRIAELETQVKILTGKATAAGTFFSFLPSTKLHKRLFTTWPLHSLIEFWRFKMLKSRSLVDKLADYEDELRQLKSANNNPTSLPNPNINAPPPPSQPTSAAGTGTQRNHLQSRISHLLTSNRRSISQPPSSSSSGSAAADQTGQSHHTMNHNNRDNAELLTLLTREQSLRQAAESRVSETNDELEELSAQLFTEANEMVAAERKARAKLEERVAVLERRDREKRTRLEVLEGRLGRIERVREMLK